MVDSQFKRNVAYKFRIGDLLVAKPIFSEEKFSFLELGDKKIVRVNVVGNIVERFDSTNPEKNYTFFTLDDGSGQLPLKVFGDDVEKFKNVTQGMTVVVIGVVRYWNDQIYVTPEIIKESDSKYLLLRKLETEKQRSEHIVVPVEKEQIVAIKDRILEKIKNAEEDGGVEMDSMIMELRDVSPQIIHQEVQKLLEEGIVFEPRPGKVRYLG